MVIDPVCHMELEEDEAISLDVDGKIWHFCSEGCRDRFLDRPKQKQSGTSFDLAIVGGGPAGLTAAVYASLLRVNTFLIASNLGGQAIDSTKIKNYMGYDLITGPELIAKFKDQLIHTNYVAHSLATVDRIKPENGEFTLGLSDGSECVSKAVLVATGMTRRRLNVPGAEDYQRRGVFHGSVHDISSVEDKDVAVVGGGNSAIQLVEKLQRSARTIHVVSDMELTADRSVIERVFNDPRIHLHEGYKVSRIDGTKSVERIVIRRLVDSTEVSLDVAGVFVNIGLRPNSALMADLATLNEAGEVVISPDCSTTQPGLYAAGDVTDVPGKRIIIAAGEGAKAAIAVKSYLRLKKRASSETSH